MRSSPDQPPPARHPLPLVPLAVLLLFLVVSPAVLVILLLRPERHTPPNASQVKTASPGPSEPDSHPPSPTTAPSRSASIRPRPRRPRELLERHLEAHFAAQPTEEPSRSIEPGRQTGPAPDCSATILSSGTSVYSPWAALDASDALLSLAAPLGRRYLVMAVRIEAAVSSRAELHLADRPDAPADLRLEVDAPGGDRSVSLLGRLSDPADRLVPFDNTLIRLTPTEPWVVLALAFLVPDGATSARLVIGGEVLQTIVLPEPEPVDIGALGATWHKQPGQRLHLRYADSILDALANPRHRLLSVRSTAQNAWVFEFPFTEVTASPALPRVGGRVFPLTLTRGASERSATARLAGGGELLILYLGNQPQERLVYRAIRR